MNKLVLILTFIVTIFIYIQITKSSFNDKLINNVLTNEQPKNFPPITTSVPSFQNLAPPVVPEEIGLAMVYPQGQGVGMNRGDSNSFEPSKPGPLLTDYTIPESYGESSLSDPYGIKGSDQAARILRINSIGDQLNYKPTENNTFYSAAYVPGMVEKENNFNFNKPINYEDNYKPSDNFKLEASPGQMSTLNNCEQTYPNTTKYNNFCITKGDIPYGQIVNNQVNPRLVDRWQSFTGEYSRQDALEIIDGTLYPNLGVLAST